MEVMVPTSPIMEFDFNSSPGSITAPSTPRRLGDCFFSAPTSPTRLSEFYREFDRFSMMSDVETSHLTIPFDWEEKPGTPKSTMDDRDDFAFDFRGALETTSVPAEELFDGGRIKPLKPPPRFKVDDYNNQKSPLLSSPRSSPFSQGRRMIREAFSPRKQKEQRDPFATAAIETSRNDHRGRERVPLKSSSRRATRSLSPYRVSTDRWENDDGDQETTTSSSNTQSSSTLNSKPSFSSNSSSSKGSSRKWRLRDFLLFRSASEGRAADKDPLRKYSMSFFKKQDHHQDQNKKNPISSNKSSTDNRSSRRKVSAHELHYTANKAASESMKKKTFLPYKQVILGRLAFHADGFGKY